MNKALFEQMGGSYHQEGDYLLPNLTVPQSALIGIWGQRRIDYLRHHKEPIYTGMLLSGKLDAHLAEIDQQAEGMFSHLVERMALAEGVNESLKATDQMAWVGQMNNICNRATEVVLNELIYG